VRSSPSSAACFCSIGSQLASSDDRAIRVRRSRLTPASARIKDVLIADSGWQRQTLPFDTSTLLKPPPLPLQILELFQIVKIPVRNSLSCN